jgi:predicted DsbA family dithiol-disulfide isomerase
MTPCDAVKFFVKLVKAHIGNGLNIQQAQVLLAIAAKISQRLGCPP